MDEFLFIVEPQSTWVMEVWKVYFAQDTTYHLCGVVTRN